MDFSCIKKMHYLEMETLHEHFSVYELYTNTHTPTFLPCAAGQWTAAVVRFALLRTLKMPCATRGGRPYCGPPIYIYIFSFQFSQLIGILTVDPLTSEQLKNTMDLIPALLTLGSRSSNLSYQNLKM